MFVEVSKKPIILFSKKDYKFEMWSASLKSQGVLSIAPKSGRLILGIVPLIRHVRSKKAVVFRYLNDRRSFFQSLFFLISDLFTCALCWLFNIRRIWILHNVDQESSVHFEKLVEIRRNLVAKCVHRILVTDPLLIEFAKAKMPKYEHKIGSTTFGPYETGLIRRNQRLTSPKIDQYLNNFIIDDFDQLINLIAEKKKDYDFVGFCGGRFSKKRTNFFEIPNLLAAARQNKIKLLLVVISDLNSSDDEELYNYLMNSSEVMFFNSLMDLDEEVLSSYIDFYWSGYRDISVPYTLYTAATVRRPILSVDSGVLPKLVRGYRLGWVLDHDYGNIIECFENIKDEGSCDFEGFLNSHSWDLGAASILEASFQ